MKIGVDKGRSVNPKLKIGICGEHGGEPKSVKFCAELDLDYVSCSPYRIPIARLAAAQAGLLARQAARTKASAAEKITETPPTGMDTHRPEAEKP